MRFKIVYQRIINHAVIVLRHVALYIIIVLVNRQHSTVHSEFVCVSVCGWPLCACVYVFVLAIPVCLDPCDLVDCGDSVTSGYSEPVWGNDLVSPPDLTDLSEVSPHSYLSFLSYIPLFPDVSHDNISGRSRESSVQYSFLFIIVHVLVNKLTCFSYQ